MVTVIKRTFDVLALIGWALLIAILLGIIRLEELLV